MLVLTKSVQVLLQVQNFGIRCYARAYHMLFLKHIYTPASASSFKCTKKEMADDF